MNKFDVNDVLIWLYEEKRTNKKRWATAVVVIVMAFVLHTIKDRDESRCISNQIWFASFPLLPSNFFISRCRRFPQNNIAAKTQFKCQLIWWMQWKRNTGREREREGRARACNLCNCMAIEAILLNEFWITSFFHHRLPLYSNIIIAIGCVNPCAVLRLNECWNKFVKVTAKWPFPD